MFRTELFSLTRLLVIFSLTHALKVRSMTCTVRKCNQCSSVFAQKMGSFEQQEFCKGHGSTDRYIIQVDSDLLAAKNPMWWSKFKPLSWHPVVNHCKATLCDDYFESFSYPPVKLLLPTDKIVTSRIGVSQSVITCVLLVEKKTLWSGIIHTKNLRSESGFEGVGSVGNHTRYN